MTGTVSRINGPTNHRGRLLREILAGQLDLRGDYPVRCNFSVSIGRHPIGVYRIASIKPKQISLLRAWNRSSEVVDPFTGLCYPARGKQFWRVSPGSILFLVEFDQNFTGTVDRVAVRVGKATVLDVAVPNASADLKFEAAELSELEVVG